MGGLDDWGMSEGEYQEHYGGWDAFDAPGVHTAVAGGRGSSTRRRARNTQEAAPRAAAAVSVPALPAQPNVTDVRDLLWCCMDGRVLPIGDMDTRHLFNAMKMLFNHIAEAHGGIPVWFTKTYEDYQRKARGDVTDLREMALLCAVFAVEIELRGDLDPQYWKPYDDITGQMRGTLRMAQARLLTAGGKETDADGNTQRDTA